MKFFKSVLIVLLIFTGISLSKEKEVKKSFKIEADQAIDIKSLSGLKVKVKSWDKNEIFFDLKVKVNCSNKEFEDDYLEYFDISETNRFSSLMIKFEELEENDGWSFWDIFKGKFYYNFSKEITGDIFVPQNCALTADFHYSIISLDGLSGDFNLRGRSNDLLFKNCNNLQTIENDYGKVFIENSGGKLTLNSRSNEVKITSFSGPIRLIAEYSEIELKSITGKTNITTRSAEIKIEDISSDLDLAADYSNVSIRDIKGFVNLSNRSGSIDVYNVDGIKVNAPYTRCSIEKVTGKSGKPVEIFNRSGYIALKSIISNIDIDDSYSDMTFDDITGDIIMESRSNTIKGRNIKGSLDAKLQYSKIILEKLSSTNINIVNRSEIVSLQLLKNPQKLKVDNIYGGIDVTIPENYSGKISIDNQYGEIYCDFPVKYKNQGNRTILSGNIGNGNSEIILQTQSADINLKQTGK